MSKKRNFLFSALASVGCSLVATAIHAGLTAYHESNPDFLSEFLRLIASPKFLVTLLYIAVAAMFTGGFFLNLVIPTIKDMNNRSRMAKLAGLVDVLQFSPVETRNLEFRKNLRDQCRNQRNITILCSTGRSIFGSEESLLGDTLASIKNTVTVFLLNPSISSEGALARAESRKMPHEELRANIIESISYLKNLQSYNLNVKIYLYSHYPDFGIIQIQDFVWVQSYDSQSELTASPTYGFQKLGDGKGLQNMYCFFDNYLIRLCQRVKLKKQNELYKSVQLIENIDEWRYPGDLAKSENLSVKNIYPCARVSGVQCRRNIAPSNSETYEDKRNPYISDRRRS